MDPDIDFAALFDQFDTFIMGRGTYDAMVAQQGSGATPGKQTLVVSRTLRQQDHPDVTVVRITWKKPSPRSRKNPARTSGYSVADRSSAVCSSCDSSIPLSLP